MTKKLSQEKVGLVSGDLVGKSMAGPGIRYLELAKALASHFNVTLFVPGKTDIESSDFSIVEYDSTRASSDIAKKTTGFSVLIAQSFRPPLLWKLKKSGIRFIADLYDPLLIEVLEYAKDDKKRLREATFDFNFYSLSLQLSTADHILCASDRQKDYYTGVLSGQKLLTFEKYDRSENLADFISIAPFGLPAVEPKAKNPEAIYKKFPGIKKSDKIIYWGGGIWNWFDPLSAIKAVEILSKKRKDIKLFFLGVKHPNPKIKEMQSASRAFEYAKEKGLIDKFVFFNFEWTPYEERADYLTECSIGISTHFDNAETRFSFRTRVLDYIWAKLPMVVTRGDSFADLCEKRNLGRVVDFEKPLEIAEAIEEIVEDKKVRDEIKSNLKEMSKEFYWGNIASEIAKVIENKKYLPAKFSTVKFLNLTFDFYKAGLLKKLAK